MHHRIPNKAFSLVELLVTTAVVGILSAILFPVLSHVNGLAAAKSNAGNLRRIARAAILYGDDAEERLPIMVNGAWRNLRNVRDGDLTQYNEQRTDAWPILITPYLKDRQNFVDPERGDLLEIFRGPALASSDPGYVSQKNTYRNQSMSPYFGVNYVFLSPLVIPASKMGDTTPVDFAVGEPRRFFQALQPEKTIFYVPSKATYVSPVAPGDLSPKRGFFAVNAPGMWEVLHESSVPYVLYWTDAPCAGDWCGQDLDPSAPGVQTSQAQAYMNPASNGNNVAMLDGHVRFLKANQMAAGTDYATAVPKGGPNMNSKPGGTRIVDKTKYLWNLDDFYYGA